MKIIKIVTFSIVVILIVFLISAAFMPREKYIEVQRTILTDPVAVYQELYSREKELKKSLVIEGPDWLKLITIPQQKISICNIEADPYKKIIYQLEINSNCTIDYGFLLEPSEEGTVITSFIHLKAPTFPFQRWKSLFMPLYLKPGLQKELDRLNKVLME